jgi:phosphohistidine phosphatase SixA
MLQRRRRLLGAGLLAGLGASNCALAADADIDLRQHGLLLLIRHAVTEPGIGDPPGFRLGDCATQRNLSEEGRAQARRMGAELAARGWVPKRVRNSAWCRCADTARLAFGRAETWPALNSFFQERGGEPEQTAELRRALAALQPGRIEAWVTHQVNVTALTGGGVTMGEVLLLRGGSADGRVLQRLAP